MDERENNILDAFIRMREFNTRNQADYAAQTEAAAQFNIIDSAIDELEDHQSAQSSGARGQAVERKAVLVAAIRRKMKDIARTARALNIADEGFRHLFSIPESSSQQKLLAAAREFASEAARHKADFLRLAMPADFIDELNEDIADFERATGDKASAQGTGTSATAGVDAEIERGMNAAVVLDAMMKNIYRDNSAKLAEWMQARHVRRSARKPSAPVTQPNP